MPDFVRLAICTSYRLVYMGLLGSADITCSAEILGLLFPKRGKVFARSLPAKPEAGGPGGFPPAQEGESQRPSCPYSSGGYSLLERRTPLTRAADTPYLPERRQILLTRAGVAKTRVPDSSCSVLLQACLHLERVSTVASLSGFLFFSFFGGGRGPLDTQATPATSVATAHPDPGHPPHTHLSGGRRWLFVFAPHPAMRQ